MISVISPPTVLPSVEQTFNLSFINETDPTYRWVQITYPDFLTYTSLAIAGGWTVDHDPDARTITLTGATIPTNSQTDGQLVMEIGGELTNGDLVVMVSENADGSDPVQSDGNLNIQVANPPSPPVSNNTELLVIAWLKSLDQITDAWPVSGDLPKSRPDSFITVDRTGGPREAMVLDAAVILVEVYHKTSRTTASEMANYIADQVPQLPVFAENITGASVNSLVNLDDIIGEYSRYQLYLDVYNRR